MSTVTLPIPNWRLLRPVASLYKIPEEWLQSVARRSARLKRADKVSPSPWMVEDVVIERLGFPRCVFAVVSEVLVLLVSTQLPLLSAGPSYKQERARVRATLEGPRAGGQAGVVSWGFSSVVTVAPLPEARSCFGKWVCYSIFLILLLNLAYSSTIYISSRTGGAGRILSVWWVCVLSPMSTLYMCEFPTRLVIV